MLLSTMRGQLGYRGALCPLPFCPQEGTLAEPEGWEPWHAPDAAESQPGVTAVTGVSGLGGHVLILLGIRNHADYDENPSLSAGTVLRTPGGLWFTFPFADYCRRGYVTTHLQDIRRSQPP